MCRSCITDVSYVQTITHPRHLESFHTNHSFRLLPLKRMKVDGRVAAATSTVRIPFLWKSVYYRHACIQLPFFHQFVFDPSFPLLQSVFVIFYIFFSFYCSFSFCPLAMSFVNFGLPSQKFLLHNQFILTQSCGVPRNETSKLKTNQIKYLFFFLPKSVHGQLSERAFVIQNVDDNKYSLPNRENSIIYGRKFLLQTFLCVCVCVYTYIYI